MAVEAPNMNLFPPQFIPNGADSGVTCNMNFPVSAHRKRPRDGAAFGSFTVSRNDSFAGVVDDDDDVVSRIQQQQRQEIECLIAQHIGRVRLELEERRKRQSRALIMAVQESVMKKLKEKDDEIQRMGKLNWVLQEKVKSLCLENQLWRDMAQTNEATANSLRTDLEQVLAHVGEERHANGVGVDDAESSCGSSDGGWRKVVVPSEQGGEQAAAEDGRRRCRKCGGKESSVLLLPCRHLCLCAMCGSTLVGTCPVCHSVTNASVHVNMS